MKSENPCYGCFKPAWDNNACTICSFIKASDIVNIIRASLPAEFDGLDESIIDEARYEVMTHLPQRRGKEVERMIKSGLASIIGKCSDTAIYLSRKRYEDHDDLKALLFDVLNNEVFITNGDVVIRISDIPPSVLSGLNADIPVYDYMSARFIPNSLPYTLQELNTALFNEFEYTITLPIQYILDFIYGKYPDAIDRRGTITVLDVGLGVLPESLIIPRFTKGANKKPYALFNGLPPMYVGNDSTILGGAIEYDKSYCARVVEHKSETLILDVYKEYEAITTIGIFKLMENPVEDDLHPFNLANYAEDDKIDIPLVTEHGFSAEDVMCAFNTFYPIVFETEYLYYILLLMMEFKFCDFTINVCKSPTDPVMIEALREDQDQPSIEVRMATIILGNNGQRCVDVINSVV